LLILTKSKEKGKKEEGDAYRPFWGVKFKRKKFVFSLIMGRRKINNKNKIMKIMKKKKIFFEFVYFSSF
jgi:hypothetical protein